VITLVSVTEVEASPEVCFDLALDVQEHAKSLSYTDEHIVEGRRTGCLALNDTMTMEGRHFGIVWRLKIKLTECDRPRRFVDEMVAGPFKSVRHEHVFEQTPSGTRVTDTFQFVAPLGPLGWLAERLFLKRHMEKLLARRNAYLKAKAEAQ
jgi:ligand-binding SRPBCC domain-containing protein